MRAVGAVRAGLATIEAGAGRRPLVLLHGFTGAKEDFVWHLEDFAAAGWHVVSVDLPGHGASHPEGATFGFDAYADALLAVADDLGWGRFAIVGHSMGGIAAQHLALRAQDRLTALVLTDTSPDRIAVDASLVSLACLVVTTDGLPALLAAQRAIGSPLETEPARRLKRDRPGWEGEQEAKLLACSGEMYVAMAQALVSAADRSPSLASLTVPTLVAVGEHDSLLLEPSRRLAAAIPGARLVIVPDAGHNPHVESPVVWFALVSGFLDDVVPP